MNKVVINHFISKYYLSGLIESVKWEIENNTLKTGFISDDKSAAGFVTLRNFEFENSVLGIYNTTNLVKMFNILDNNVNVVLNKRGNISTSLELSSGNLTTNFMLANLEIIPKVPPLKSLPEWDVNIRMTSEFIQTFIKGYGAISNNSKFTLAYDKKKDTYQLVLGYAEINSDRIAFDVNATSDGSPIEPISFSAPYFVEILKANREYEDFTLMVSSQGLAHIRFESNDITSEYYLVKIQNV